MKFFVEGTLMEFSMFYISSLTNITCLAVFLNESGDGQTNKRTTEKRNIEPGFQPWLKTRTLLVYSITFGGLMVVKDVQVHLLPSDN